MGAQEKCLKTRDRDTEPSVSVQSKFLVTSRALPARHHHGWYCMDRAGSSPFPPRTVSAFLSIPQLPSPTAFQESIRYQSKESACTKVCTGCEVRDRQGIVNGQPIAILQFAFLRVGAFCLFVGFFVIFLFVCFWFFTIKSPPYFSSPSFFFFFSFKEKEFSAI